jgi:aspartate kinase
VIVMKFGGSSVGRAERILAVAEIVRSQRDRAPVVVVSALAGVTDLLDRAGDEALRGDRESLERTVAEVERRHRWAVAGCIEAGDLRHRLGLELDRLFESLHQRLRSVRVLGEATSRARDALLALGEAMASHIVSATLCDRGLAARWVDPGAVMITDAHFGAARPDLARVGEACRRLLQPLVEQGAIPVVGGFAGATPEGETTTLGRGGSDTSATVLGLAMAAEEIQIWTDVDGLMSADPRLVPAARTLEQLSFAEAAELAFFGARVLHPDAVAPAVERQIPVRVLNSHAPHGRGTLIVQAPGETAGDAPVALASRSGLQLTRVTRRRLSRAPGFLPTVLEQASRCGVQPDLVLASGVSVALVGPETGAPAQLARALEREAVVEELRGRSLVSVVGSGLRRRDALLERVLAAVSCWAPELVVVGPSGLSVAAVLGPGMLDAALPEIHRQFFEAPVAR